VWVCVYVCVNFSIIDVKKLKVTKTSKMIKTKTKLFQRIIDLFIDLPGPIIFDV